MLKSKKILTMLLLAAFLVTSFGSVFGCIACDCGTLSSTHLTSHLDDHSDHDVDEHRDDQIDVHVCVTLGDQFYLLDQHFHGCGDSCFDAPIQIGSGLIEDSPNLQDLERDALFVNLFWSEPIIHTQTLLPSSHLKPEPRISLSILSHRTVVLLS